MVQTQTTASPALHWFQDLGVNPLSVHRAKTRRAYSTFHYEMQKTTCLHKRTGIGTVAAEATAQNFTATCTSRYQYFYSTAVYCMWLKYKMIIH